MEMNQCFLFSALIKREVVDKIGYLDEVFGVGCYDDTDYSMRAGLAGYRCVCLHSAYVHHIHGVSFKAMGNRDKIVAACEKEYFKKWPRHLRAGIAFSLAGSVKDEEIANLLGAMLYLAREWCWINLWVFGNKDDNRRRLEAVSKSVGMPLHQNIKFNFLSEKNKNLHVLIRLVERSFGTKRRKKYDFVLVDGPKSLPFLKAFNFLHGTRLVPADFRKGVTGDIAKILVEFRKKK
ncbi:MAG: hypothetical protein NTW09_03105, partial [Candidatus Omnitrophica bacterium]|nr:hypothetical protein [Candidatus Omnitrophota bacterium]